ncbi:MAG: hypothetical protein QN173_10845 [Armatimonadota bacterium]|nr:hypothetical protein [Armatimonadota bacterium]MDR7401195.1 hypothetical protein [Armatimonadota bacterium]MDR7403045.1 hypothetical protein [Armatimonadota bacterium]MDR7438200.1 hypothetical protein [Armatimonadota bacterium]MDR7471848.1 hypothetical protein [Armatimonadota bacterium]
MSGRLRIDDVRWTAGEAAAARVRLSYRSHQAEGVASASGGGKWREAVAEATLRAVRAFIPDASEMTVDAVTEVRSGRHPLVVVTMTRGCGREETFLSGTAILSGEGGWAVARAVLHGLNRWVEARLDIDGAGPPGEADPTSPVRIHGAD